MHPLESPARQIVKQLNYDVKHISDKIPGFVWFFYCDGVWNLIKARSYSSALQWNEGEERETEWFFSLTKNLKYFGR